ncbi:related to ALG14-component of UDP-GlcNAc transferase [Ustilago bromivora]|uniref:UDP-N-acetylglucosamine transferase subunit ALG14 n=1 Tax=Ustilago bromivora TaxID=307758 RepID=A0A1K0HKV4_9BASI|nr:related to ALG14-component of UDP-GlcNAc transferase [Ustilago bromivora]
MDEIAAKCEAGKLYLQRPLHQILPASLVLDLIPGLPSFRLVLCLFAIAAILLLRLSSILPSRKSRGAQRSRDQAKTSVQHSVAVFLGSGGHTAELLQLLSALPTDRYTQRIYLVSSGDRFSVDKAKDLERRLCSTSPDKRQDRPSSAKVIQIPRARRVGQSLLTTPLTLARSVAFCADHVALRPLLRPFNPNPAKPILADLILMNGPATCVPIVVAVYLLRILGLRSPKLIYVESFARVKSSSLTAKLIRPFVDCFLLQWPRDPSEAQPKIKTKATSNTIFSGWLI